ncbi:hypothetical protein [Streptomyces sp. NPDC056785]|uniref:hypothetical protein n=1 Tax=Streptomyces sp. NPDC056785 TaxID=3345944 RepID=UPI0036771EC9
MPVGRQREWIQVTTLAVPTIWMATADGLVCLDLIAVEFAINGQRKGPLTRPETVYAADLLFQRGVTRTAIAKRLGLSGNTLRSWYPTDETPLAHALAAVANLKPLTVSPLCGTQAGYRRHERLGEVRCQPCKSAQAAAKRHYVQHGTYLGAPGAVA